MREHRTSVDWVHEVKQFLDGDFSHAHKVILVCDNLNTHKIASLYETFDLHEARRLAEKLELHYTLKQGSWLNVAEIELSVLTQQCLNRRIPDMLTLWTEIKAWECSRNKGQKGIDWRFTTQDVRIKFGMVKF